ncbi:MAG: nicotinamide-nucleotide amidohydrolase family protein [Acidimicrobiia bacterium]|nr:nicotinamide-nucleotide amidohydrolase family protein [Acidimicrobiia bacterium]
MDDAELAAAIAERLEGRAVACAESFTAGRISEAFAGVTKASEWFRGGVVAYQVGVKRALLGVEAASVFSEAAAAEMATGVGELLDADVTVSSTGVAGDVPEDGVPPGTVVIGTTVGDSCRTDVHHFEGDALAVCVAATRQALEDLLDHLESVGPDQGGPDQGEPDQGEPDQDERVVPAEQHRGERPVAGRAG